MKSKYINIRVTPEEREELKRRASQARLSVSSYVMRKVLMPEENDMFSSNKVYKHFEHKGTKPCEGNAEEKPLTDSNA